MSYPNTPTTFTSLQNQGNRFNYFHLGMGDLSNGLIQVNQINGIGLVTRGFIWQLGEVWGYPESYAPILATSWVDGDAVITTGWTSAFGYAGSTATITTTWADSRSFGNEILE